jgi:hypothetical protein
MTMDFTSAVRAHGINALKRVDRIRRASALEVMKLIIYATPVDTGRARGNWQISLNAPMTVVTGRDDRGGGAVMAEAMANLGSLTDVVWMTNNLPYIKKLEYDGHSQQAPNGMFRKAVARWDEIVTAKAGSMQ